MCVSVSYTVVKPALSPTHKPCVVIGPYSFIYLHLSVNKMLVILGNRRDIKMRLIWRCVVLLHVVQQMAVCHYNYPHKRLKAMILISTEPEHE